MIRKRGGVLVLRGVAGIVNRHEAVLPPGGELIVGRSRSCGFSLRRCLPGEDMSLADREFLRVSRHHFRVAWSGPGLVEVEDLSRNGTFVDGRRVDRVQLRDLETKPAEIHMGGRDRFLLEWRD